MPPVRCDFTAVRQPRTEDLMPGNLPTAFEATNRHESCGLHTWARGHEWAHCQTNKQYDSPLHSPSWAPKSERRICNIVHPPNPKCDEVGRCNHTVFVQCTLHQAQTPEFSEFTLDAAVPNRLVQKALCLPLYCALANLMRTLPKL